MNFLIKKNKILLMLLIYLSITYDAVYADPPVVNTPEGKPVTNVYIQDNSFGYSDALAQGDIDYYSLNAEIIETANGSYNCNGYAWAKSENMGTYWMNWDYGFDGSEVAYCTDGDWSNDGLPSYLSSSASVATHGNYEPHTNHSVRVIQNNYPVSSDGQRTHVSKWGDGPLVRHAPAHDVYALKDNSMISYYKLKTTHQDILSNYPKTWIGAGGITHTITNNTTTNQTLTIKPGASIIFQNGASLIVNGTLDANGTSSNKITLDFISPSNNGIEIYDNATADISNAVIKNANKGLYINEGYANVNNTDFINCNIGLSFYRTNYASSQPDITNCNIYKSSYDGSGTGIYLKFSSPIILNTEIYNYYTGIRTIYNSSPLLGHYTANGNNNLHNNFKNIHAFSNSNPFLGTTSYGGYNTLRYYTNNNIVALTNCNINAENNYWGSTSSSAIASGLNIGTGCSIDFEPYLYWNPNGNIALPPAKLSANQPPSITSEVVDLSSVHDLILRDKLEEALTLCNSFISESKETSNLLYAIDLLWQIERKMKQQKGKSNIDIFAELRTNSKDELVAGYSNLIAAVGEQTDRIVSLDNVLSNYGSSDIIEKGVLYSKLLYYLNEEENKEKAEGEYKILKEKYPNAPITEEALFALNSGNIPKGQDNFIEKSNTTLDEKSIDFALFENFPNPFNPTTQISYQIPKDGFVSLVIYNSLGQVISTLVNEHKPSGKYSVQFNANSLPSGVYFYKIESGRFTKINKMLLLR